MVEQSREPFLLLSLAACRTPFNPGTCASRSVSGACVMDDVLLGLRPSLPTSAEGSLLCSAGSQVLRRSPTAPERSCPPFGLWPSRTGLAVEAKTSRSPLGSRACCFSACAGSNDYAGPSNPLAFNVVVRVAFLLQDGVGVLNHAFSKLNRPAH